MVLNAQERSQRSRIAGLTTHSRHDPLVHTAPAREAFLGHFLADIPIDLPEPERRRRAQCALKAHMCRLALASAKARRQRKEAANGGAS
jgi:hypothetical protein